MKKLAWILVLLGLLAGCSARTRYAFELDAGSFLGDQVEGTVDLGVPAAFHVYLPDDDDDLATPDTGGLLAQVPGPIADALERIRLTLEATLENQGAGELTLSAAFYLAPESETDIYQPQYKVAEAAVEPNPVPPGEGARLNLSAELQSGDPAFATVQEGGGKFRVGLELAGTGQKFAYRVERFTLFLEAKPLGRLVRGD